MSDSRRFPGQYNLLSTIGIEPRPRSNAKLPSLEVGDVVGRFVSPATGSEVVVETRAHESPTAAMRRARAAHRRR